MTQNPADRVSRPISDRVSRSIHDRAGDLFRTNLSERAESIYATTTDELHRATDWWFMWLLLGQWAFALVLSVSVAVNPTSERSIDLLLGTSLGIGLLLSGPPLALVLLRPGTPATRIAVAVAQLGWSAVLIDLTGGRIETHFHIFVSLALLSLYRDWRLPLVGAGVIGIDHLVRGSLWPMSVYGTEDPGTWRFLEHVSWVSFASIILVIGCLRASRDARLTAEREASLERLNASIESQVKRKTSELRSTADRYRALVEGSHAVPWEINARTLAFTYISPQVASLFGRESDTFLHNPSVWNIVYRDDRERIKALLLEMSADDGPASLDFECRMMNAEGQLVHVRTLVSRSSDRKTLRGIMFDVTRQKKLEFELAQAQKLESVGRLAAGVAHEINTPVQFVNDSIHFVRDAITDLASLIEKYRALVQAVVAGTADPEQAAAITVDEEDADLEYVLDNVPKALERSIDGLSRVATIVRSMKEFAHPDQREMAQVDLNHAITTTLTIARNEYKYVADVVTDFGDLPHVFCQGGEMNQVFLNIVVNAAHAIGDLVAGTEDRGKIVIKTERDGDDVVVSITDTGGGIPDSVRGAIFDPFFTTKEVGKGTGQGLAIARSVVMDKHGGELTFETEQGKGTTFRIRLPIEGKKQRAAA